MRKLCIIISVLLFVFLQNKNSVAQTLTVNAGTTTTICLGDSTVIGGSPTASGGTAPYSYSWSPATGLSNANVSNPKASPATTTIYKVVVTDAASNTASATDTVIVNPLPFVSAGSNQTICSGSCVTLNASGGISYSWSPVGNISNPLISNPTVCPTVTTTYTVTVTNASGCSASADVTISIDPPLNITLTSTPDNCWQETGTMTASVTGGTAPYNYFWSPTQSNPTTPTIYYLHEGLYTVTVTDAAGCIKNEMGMVDTTSKLTVTTTVIPATCGLCNGSATANISDDDGGGIIYWIIKHKKVNVGPYTYMWSNGENLPTISNLCPGQYFVTVTGAYGCVGVSSAIITNDTIGLKIALDTIINSSCENNYSGSITVHGTSCKPEKYFYHWATNGNNLKDTTATITNLMPGTYTLIITGTSKDTAKATYYVYNMPNMYASVTTTSANCGNKGTATVSVNGGYKPYKFQWNDTLKQKTATATALVPGNYTVTVTDSVGCTTTAYAYVESGCFNIIKGRIFFDANQNCVQDSGEAGIPNKMLYAMPGYCYGNTDSAGNFEIKTPNLYNTLYAPTASAPFSLTCPSSGIYYVNFANAGDTLTGYNFGYYASPNYFDVGIHPGWTSSKPGFDKEYWVFYNNNSPNPQNVLIRFTYDSILQYDSCTQGGIQNSVLHKIEWTINNVPSNSYVWNWNNAPRIYFHVPTTATLNSILHSYFEILPINGDANPSDNTLSSDEVVTGSHDPNSKTVSPMGKNADGYITQNDTTLLYTIHFQNDGNDTAFTVVVVDTLSPYLDPSTVVPGASNHPYKFSLSGQGIVTFRFNNILLPDSTTNEPASNGYVNFTVKQKKFNPDGAEITNTAAIYFDFNEPVNTNTVKSTINSVSYIHENSAINDIVKIFPNPFHSAFTIDVLGVEDYPCIVTIYNNLSAIVKTVSITHPLFSVSSGDWSEGLYYYVVKNKQGKIIGKGKMVLQ